MIKLILCGVSGAMGKTLLESLPQDMRVVAGVAKDSVEGVDFPIYATIDDVIEPADLIVDFSHVSLVAAILAYAVEKNVPLLIASTGLTQEIQTQIDQASITIPIMQSGNYSFGVYAMMQAVSLLTELLADSDIEIVETHHKFKKDAPSGTAEMLFDTVKETRTDAVPVFNRASLHTEKEVNEVGIHSIRLGTAVGEHTVSFALDNEVVEVTHKAQSKRIFALGAFKAARYLLTKQPGRYTLEDAVHGN